METKGLLAIVVILLLGILTVLFVEMNKKTPAEQIASDIGEVTEEIGDEIDDRTDAR